MPSRSSPALPTLTPTERDILRLKALIGPPTGRKEFFDILRKSGSTMADGRPWTHVWLNSVLETLRRRGLLDEDFACPPALLHELTMEALAHPQGGRLLATIQAVLPPPFGMPHWYNSLEAEQISLRWMRLAVYQNDRAVYDSLAQWRERNARGAVTVTRSAFTGVAIPLAWLAGRDAAFQLDILAAKMERWLQSSQPDPGLDSLIEHYRQACRQDSALVAAWISVGLADLLGLRLSRLAGELAAPPPALPADGLLQALRGALALLRGQIAPAVQSFDDGLRLYRKASRKRKTPLPGLFGWLHVLALLAADDAALLGEIAQILPQRKDRGSEFLNELALSILADLAGNRTTEAAHLLDQGLTYIQSGQSNTCFALTLFTLAAWTADPQSLHGKTRDFLEHLFQQDGDGLPLAGLILAEVLEKISPRPGGYGQWREGYGSEVSLCFTTLLGQKEPWERSLASLESLLLAPAEPTVSTKSRRLVWLIDADDETVQPVEQSARGRGWTSGRPVALKRLHERDPKLDSLDEHDLAVIRTIRRSSQSSGWSGYSHDVFDLPFDRAMTALIGHPRVFDARSPEQAVELIGGQAELVITPNRGGFTLAMSHLTHTPGIVVDREAPGRWRVVTVDDKALSAAAILGRGGFTVPKSAKTRLLTLLRAELPGLPVRGEGDGLDDDTLAAADPAPVVRLAPLGEGLKATLVVRPFGPGAGPHYLPGQGSRTVSARLDGPPEGSLRRLRRDPAAELAAARALAAACPSLGDSDGFEWSLDTPEAALELLTELRSLPQPPPLEWPQGEKLALRGIAEAGKMKLSVSGGANWFQIGGQLRLDDGLVIDLKDLLARLDQTRGRFIPLDDGGFLALDRGLRAHLERLSRIATTSGKNLRVAPAAGLALRDLLEEAGSLKADARWNAFTTRLDAAAAWQPRLPAGLTAELRDYQAEGFAWMARLAQWGGGACLADDMGLGKTVQAIAVIVSLAGEGPVLVVAPTSVCGNWETELTRFAPGLTVHRLAEADDRAALLDGLEPGVVVLASYGLLVREEARLTALPWRMVVLDEAQAIKNADSQRAKTAFALQADFRLALSGTPLENNLEELWSLFQFLNPGLLGGPDVFRKRFATPISQGDVPARQALKTLLRPFLLRRTKAAVLTELPSRTEVTLRVEAGPEERAFYEALRQSALDKLADSDGPPGQQRMRVLAEILRLRQACCDAALITGRGGLAAAVDIPSAKREAFLDLVAELRDNGHRALVFSQFVGHLERMRAALDERRIAYQYLDGATPAREREKRVAAFQAGAGDLFLISLKAGGTGLNLTAADYVIHLDPWWNPAVEDQASDRAHRIGQQRPVTIYRLIVGDSIEEGILALHRRKRDLADALLEGADASASLSLDDLLTLIRGAVA